MKNIYLDDKIKYYPNPIQNYLSLILPSEHLSTSISVFDINGKLIIQKNNIIVNQGRVELDLSSLKSGNYILNIETNSTNKIIKIVKK